MTVRERTRQQLDPAGTIGVRPITIVASAAAFGYALVMMLRTSHEITNPLFALLALTSLAVACGIVISASSAYRAPFSGKTHLAVTVSAFLGVIFAAMASWGSNLYVRDDWASISLGMLSFAIASYRPAREIVGIGSIVAIFLGFLTLLQVPSFVIDAPPVAFVAEAVAPLLALCFGAAVFSSTFVTSLERWHKRASRATISLARELRDGIARSVQQDRVTILNRDVVPFFSEVLTRGEVTNEDRERAHAIADSIRTVMVAEADRSWLETVIEHAGSHGEEEHDFTNVVEDRQRLAPLLTTDQRTALRALIDALFELPHFDRTSLSIVFTRRGSGSRAVFTARVDAADYAVKAALAPYLAVMRVVFTDLQVVFVQPVLAIRISYEQR